MGEPPQHRPIVTLTALYGAGGRVVGPKVAKRLGVEFLDRGISRAVAAETGLPEKAVDEVEQEPRSRLGRFASSMGRLSTVTGGGGGALEGLDLQDSAVRGRIEELIARSRGTGGVVLGHGGMVVLWSVPWALHVYLRGPRKARVSQAASVYGIDVETAAQRQKSADRARLDYGRRAYGIDVKDPSLYHLVLDSTALSLDACADIIVDAANARVDDPRPNPRADERHDD
jgi:cytidylate kinase